MKNLLLSLIITLLFLSFANADPLTEEQIESFSISNLNDKSFDKRMETFRIIEQKKWQEKYKKEAIEAITAQLSSHDVMLNRTGIQGQNLLMYSNEKIDVLIIKLAKDYDYKKGNQSFYFQQSLIEYLAKKIGKKYQCTDKKASSPDYEVDWDSFVIAVIEKDLRGVATFAGSDSIDAEVLIKVLNNPLILDVLRKTNYADLTLVKREAEDNKTTTFYEFSADSSKNGKIKNSVKLYFSKGERFTLINYLAPREEALEVELGVEIK
ncbi:MAG: hypothetical protein KAH22_06830 [Thiotrichaceae bacterium]|nr:hypothetical protein [Thiotrichaceae bacterium]